MNEIKNIDRKIKNLSAPKEKKIEKSLCDMVKSKKGACLKFISPGYSGVPDRICLLPNGKMWFVETKRQDKNSDPLQDVIHELFYKLGFKVRVVSNYEQLKQFEREISAL